MWHDRDLASELTRLVQELAEPYGLQTRVDVSPDLSPHDAIDVASQIVREATSNALRHSESPTVEIGAVSGSASLILTITDRGKGFDPASVVKGLGLSSLRSRA